MGIIEAGQAAPDFTLNRLDGDPFTRRDLDGRLTVPGADLVFDALPA